MRAVVAVAAAVLLAGCAGTSAPRVASDPPGPDHLLALSSNELDGWSVREPGEERGCLSRFAAGLGGTVETVSLGKGSASLLEEIRTIPGDGVEGRYQDVSKACPRESSTPEKPRHLGGFRADAVVQGSDDAWSVWQPTDTGVLVLEGKDISLADAYAAVNERQGVWQRDRLARAMALWKSKGPTSYTMTQTWSCFCSVGAYRVTVVDDVVTHSVNDKGKDNPKSAETVSTLYDELDKQKQTSFLLRWDPVLGYPTAISTDPELNAVDDEYGIRITGFVAS